MSPGLRLNHGQPQGTAGNPADELEDVKELDPRATPNIVDTPGCPRVTALTVATTASLTKVKSRVCRPSPNTVIGLFRIAARKNR